MRGWVVYIGAFFVSLVTNQIFNFYENNYQITFDSHSSGNPGECPSRHPSRWLCHSHNCGCGFGIVKFSGKADPGYPNPTGNNSNFGIVFTGD